LNIVTKERGRDGNRFLANDGDQRIVKTRETM